MINYMRCSVHPLVMDKEYKMNNLANEIREKINDIYIRNGIETIILSDLYNIQYATGIKIPCSHAQPDLVMIALLNKNDEAKIILPEHWVASASQTKFDGELISYKIDQDPFDAAKSVLESEIAGTNNIGSDDDVASIMTSRMIEGVIKDSGGNKLSVSDDIMEERVIKTKAEIHHIQSISLKTDHAINGYFHHLIADRSKSSMSISENLRIHSLERDIEIEGYNACSRGVLGQSIEKIWAYAPAYGFASDDFTEIGDTIIADAMNNERGYWSNSTRIGIMADDMNADQEEAYDQLVKLRNIVCENLTINHAANQIYMDIVNDAETQNIAIIENHRLGFSVGVSAMEPPFLSAGDQTQIEEGMIIVIDGLIEHKGLLYRSRDTVVITDNGPEILNWYKDWREPYFALNTI